MPTVNISFDVGGDLQTLFHAWKIPEKESIQERTTLLIHELLCKTIHEGDTTAESDLNMIIDNIEPTIAP